MFGPITLPFGTKMLFNTIKLKPGVTFEQIELAVGELCMIIKETFGNEKGGCQAEEVFKKFHFPGRLAVDPLRRRSFCDRHVLAAFEDHEKSSMKSSTRRSPRCQN